MSQLYRVNVVWQSGVALLTSTQFRIAEKS